MRKIYLIFAYFMMTMAVHSQWTQLNHEELSSVEYEGIVYTGTSVIMATEGGVFRSADNGETWQLSVTGMDTTSTFVRDITYLSSRNEIWLSGNGIYKSTDDGLTWSKVALTGLDPFGWLNALGRINQRLVIMYTYYSQLLFEPVNQLFYSDDGITWWAGKQLSSGNDAPWWEMVAGDNSKALYMVRDGQMDNPTTFWYTNDAVTVSLHPLEGLGADTDFNSRAFSIDYEGENLFFVNGNEPGFYRYNSIEMKWENITSGISLPGYEPGAFFSIQTTGSELFGSALFMNESSEMLLKLFRSVDKGDTWTDVSTPGLDFPIFEKKMIKAGNNRIIGNYFHSRLAVSDDNGLTWTLKSSIMAGDFYGMVSSGPSYIYSITEDQTKGIIVSMDNGETWSQNNGDLVNFNGVYLINSLLSTEDELYVSAAEAPFTEDLSLYLSQNGGTNWTKLTNAPDSAGIQNAGMNGSGPVFYFKDRNDNGTYQYTLDLGETWTDLTPLMTGLGIDRVLGFKGKSGRLFLFAETEDQTRVYLSQEGGPFVDVTLNLGSPFNHILVANRWNWEQHPMGIGSFDLTGTYFYLAARDYSTFPSEVAFYYMASPNTEWIKAGAMPFANEMEWYSLTHSIYGWFFVTPAGVYASTDNCETWLPVWNNEGFSMGVIPVSFLANNYGVFMGTRGAGIWKANLAAPSISTLTPKDITSTSAVSGLIVNSTGGLPFASKGFCWNDQPSPTINNYVIYSDTSWADFTDTLKLLNPNTTYYVRAFVNGYDGLVYGNETNFNTDVSTLVRTETDTNLLLYPNPSGGQFSIVSESACIMDVFDLTGKKVYSMSLYPGINTINLKDQPRGIYFIKMNNSANEGRMIKIVINRD